jgi:hypothetical protein
MMTSTSGEFYTPAELCARWKIDPRTLDKLDLPWKRITPRVRRIHAEIVLSFEKAQNFKVE